MKKHLFIGLLACLAATPSELLHADVVDKGRTTEGTDFWVTFPRADESGSKEAKPFLAISAKKAGNNTIHIINESLGLDSTITMTAADNRYKEVEIPQEYCYVSESDDEKDNCYKALHVTATDTISLYAGNWPWKTDNGKKVCASFDVTNVLPQPSLGDQYIIQAYKPSDHDDKDKTGAKKCQGSHFVILATEDNTVVDFCLTAATYKMNQVRKKIDAGITEEMLSEEDRALLHYQIGKDTLTTPILQKGQVYYLWTGNGELEDYDLTGSWIQAREGKKIAVFNGVPHTNIPDYVRNRDQLFEQAMPIEYWGTKFAVTASEGRYKDRVAILALNDETTVHIKYNLADGSIKDSLVHTFDFASNPKRYWEFEFNTDGADFKFESCFIETSCPCAVHLVMVSNAHDQDKDAPGDPSLAWINPIEQVISEITFSTFQEYNHYVNIVTDTANIPFMHLKGMSQRADSSLAKAFKPLNGNPSYAYARIKLDNKPKAYSLEGKTGFIAGVYGLGNKESYSYSVGGATKRLTQTITINGQTFSPDTENTLCSEDTIRFACHPDFTYEKIEWNFGDGASRTVTYEEAQQGDSIVPHYYENSGVYEAYVRIYRESSNLCAGQQAIYTIPVKVTIGRYKFSILETEIPCPDPKAGSSAITTGKIYYTNEGGVNLHGNNVILEFDQAAKDAGFQDDELVIYDDHFQFTVPAGAKAGSKYHLHLKINSDCGGADTTMGFTLPFSNDVITQRYDNILGLKAEYFTDKKLSDFQWYRNSDSTAIEGQVSANLNFYDISKTEDKDEAYYVCFTETDETGTTTTCACAKTFTSNTDELTFNEGTDLNISASYSAKAGGSVFVNADWGGKTDLDCYAQWINAAGQVYGDLKFNIPDGGCTIAAPNSSGLYLLRVVTGGNARSFKFIINQ